jgi:PIN domain nuclease of toxin-antitoxin system
VRLLLDAHTLIWAVDDPAKLGPNAAKTLQDPGNDLLLSAGTIWEIAIKVGLGKLSLSMPYCEWMNRVVADLRATVLPITITHASAQIRLPKHHGDPFDRLLLAQAEVENMDLVSNDAVFDKYGTRRIW